MNTLTGKRIVVTRAAAQANALAQLLADQGADPILYPCLAFAPPLDPAPLPTAAKRLATGDFNLLVLTSVTAVDAIAALCPTLPVKVRVATVGPTTAAAALEKLHTKSEIVPEEYTGEALGNAIRIAAGDRILLPQSALTDDGLELILARRGAQVTRVNAYRTVMATGGADLAPLLRAGTIHAITLTSGSAARYLIERLGPDATRAVSLPAACIGNKTAAVAANLGFSNLIVPAEHTLKSLVTALADRLGTP